MATVKKDRTMKTYANLYEKQESKPKKVFKPCQFQN